MAHHGKPVVLAALVLAAWAAPAFSQSTGQSVSATFAVSVTVVRSCGVSTPATTASSSAAGAGELRLSCGRTPSTSPLHAGGIIPVSGATVPASVSTSKGETGLVVSVNF
jgi:hypothetical protein